ncbi:fibronectin type III domain-containing protein [Aquimarina algiphila]|uniref:Fibronectin type-III domain-containing protein n=1 Tax=Aquimarina algiphila TaxID=2047982 RepID=A0A554VD83_9FLAO|nr:hypothetical protein [Aquimarina algiphila]TSE04791.1 hypothetical protein FOF46_25135 [Aquimarina algiphila]
MIIEKTRHTILQKCLWVLVYFAVSFQGFSQRTTEDPSIRVIARVQGSKILLRWAPTTPSSWLKSNKYGYQIQRFTISRDGKLVSPPEKKVLTTTPIVPMGLERWEYIASGDDYAAILAQALFGEGFEVEGMEEEGALAQIVNKSREVEQRFSFAVFAADMNFEAAKMAALGYEDTTIVPGEEYVYKITTAIPEELLKVIPGSIVIKSQQPEPLPAPIDLIAVPDDKIVLLTWDYGMFKSIFTTYYLERSENGNDFKKLGDLPLVNLNDKPDAAKQRMQYIDTLSQNNKEYYYRVKGISPFGEESLPSKVVSAKGIKKLTATPHILKYTLEDSGAVLIEWEFLKEAENEILGFELNWSMQKKGPYIVVSKGLLPSSRKTRYQKLAASNYFTITAIGKNNQKKESLSAFVQTIDETPPAAPLGLTGTIDTLGIVTLKWDANTEKDMLGYRVFRGNLAKEEVSQVTISPINKNVFRDTVQIKSLNKNVFYQIVAVDKRFNMSEYSEKIELKKPDVVPPSSPTFSNYNVSDEGVFLEWIMSTSTDVKYHQLYRQNVQEPDKGWHLLFETEAGTTFTDNTIESNTKYRYAIFAEDNSKLRSEPSTPITIVYKKATPDENLVKGFTAIADREHQKIDLNWRKMPSEVTEILIYKAIKEEKPVLWKQISGSMDSLEDRSVSPNTIYVYYLQAMTDSGSHSVIQTKEIEF